MEQNAFPLNKGRVSSALSPCDVTSSIPIRSQKAPQAVSKKHTKSQAQLTLRQLAQLEPFVLVQLATSKVPASSQLKDRHKRITRRCWTPPPMPQEEIDQVNQLGTADRQQKLLTFHDRKAGHLMEATETP